jgi:hypothetical protein
LESVPEIKIDDDVSYLIHCNLRPVILHPKARDVIRRFPKEVRIRLGRGLFRLQMGEQIAMPNARPMPIVATGCRNSA